MTRRIKELFLKYLRSNALWKVLIFFAKIYNHAIRILRIFSYKDFFFGPPKIRNKPTKLWCKEYNLRTDRHDVIYKEIYPANITNKKLPKTLEKNIHPTLLKYINEKQYEQFVASIPQGRIIGTYTNITSDYNILWDSTRYLGEDLYSNPYTYRYSLGTPKKIDENIALLSSNDTFKNYYHWIIYVLPKFHLFQKSGLHIERYATDYVSKFNKESLECLGLSHNQILALDKKSYIQTKNLLTASTPTLFGNLPKRAISFLKKTFLDENKQKKQSKRIYISRITNRKVENEKEIFGFLKTLGFKKAILDDMSIKQQAELFNSAEIIIGPHGAGFTNLVFCQPGTKVIEIFHEKTVLGHYYALSNACELAYHYIIGDIRKDTTKIEMDCDMFIPIIKLKKTLELAKII